MNDDELYFFAEAVQSARALPLRDCLRFLRGMLRTFNPDHPFVNDLRSTIAQLSTSDAQLELIQIGQIKMHGLDSHHPLPKHEVPGTETETEGSEK